MPNPEQCRVVGCSFGADGGPYLSHAECTTYMARREDLRYHFDVDHGGINPNIVKTEVNEKKVEKERVNLKLDRPSLKSNVTEVEWTLFSAKWERYCQASGLVDGALINQFWACLDNQTETELVHKGLAKEKDVNTLIKEVKNLVLEKRNKLVQRFKFAQLKQHKDESVDRFVTRIKGKAELGEFVKSN